MIKTIWKTTDQLCNYLSFPRCWRRLCLLRCWSICPWTIYTSHYSLPISLDILLKQLFWEWKTTSTMLLATGKVCFWFCLICQLPLTRLTTPSCSDVCQPTWACLAVSMSGSNGKSEFQIIVPRHYKAKFAALSPCLRVGSTPIFPSQTVRDLSVTLDAEMSLSTHVGNIIRSMYMHMRHISRTISLFHSGKPSHKQLLKENSKLTFSIFISDHELFPTFIWWNFIIVSA